MKACELIPGLDLPADPKSRIRAEKQPATNANACGHWHLHIGTVQLFILGDAANAWLACSEPEYRTGERVGTPQERKIANRAIEILRVTQNQNPDAGADEIRAALTQAAR